MCDDLGIDNTLVKTYRLTMHSGAHLIDDSLDNILETLRVELEEADNDDLPVEYSISVENKYTRKQLDEMPEFDGF